jgi:hypothetical protein
MKKLLTLFIVFALTMSMSFAQSFEGKIFYTNAYKSKIPNVNDQQLTDMMGASQEYLMKGGDYKAISNGSLIQWQLYVNKDNKIYSKMTSSPAALWTDCSENPDEVLKSELNKGVVEILGYKCDELVLTCKTGVQKYYFSSKLPIDSKLYEKHKFGNWAAFLAKANAVPLKIFIDNQQFTIESVATDVKPMAIDSKLLELPAGLQTQKSPY